MPCNDITENLVLSLDHDFRVRHYALRKKTCGAQIGNQSLLKKWVSQRTLSEIFSFEMDTFLQSYGTFVGDITFDTFLALKHFETLKQALLAVSGSNSAGKLDSLVFDMLEYTDRGIDVRFFVNVAVDPSLNPGCGNGACGKGGCGSK